MMRQEVQWYLAEQLVRARARSGLADASDRRYITVASFGSVLDVLRHIGELTEEEQADWSNRMLAAVEIAQSESAGPGLARAIFVGHPKDVERLAGTQGAVPAFVRTIPGPDAEFEFHGGKLRVLAIDIYDSAVDVRWRAAPEPIVDAALPSEMAQVVGDTKGMQDQAAKHLQDMGRSELRRMRLYQFELSDNVGTQYDRSTGGSGGRPGERTGNMRFSPAPPAEASVLTLNWLDLQVTLRIT